jgi:hypothetical protein
MFNITMVTEMPTDPRYTKANVTPESAHVLKMLAAEKRKYIYEIVDEILRQDYPNYFHKIGC